MCKKYCSNYYISIDYTNQMVWMPNAALCCSIIINRKTGKKGTMNKDIKAMKSVAEEAIEQILEELEERGIKVFRLQVFTSKERSPQVNIIVDELGGNR